jgi:hypothetical protein
LVVHVLFLIGFRNRLQVLAEWTWAYWTWGRGNRVILRGAIHGADDEDDATRTFPVAGVPSPKHDEPQEFGARATGTGP